MKIFALGLVFLIAFCGSVHAREITADVIGGAVSYAEDIVLAENVHFMPGRMDITKTIYVENNGYFQTDIYVCDMCELYVQNRGDFSVNVNLGNQSALYRVISGADDLGNVDFGVDYSVLVRGGNNLSLDDVMNSVVGAGRIIIQDSVLDLNKVGAYYSGDFELRGDVVLRIESATNTYVGPVLDNVSGDARITIESNDTDIMYADYAYINDSVLYIGRKRETDYVKILGDNAGAFVNGLRGQRENDALMLAMDTATDLDDLYDVMSRSVRFNSRNLLDVVRIIDSFGHEPMRVGMEGVDVSPFFVMSDDFYSYGMDFRVQMQMRKSLDIALNIRTGMAEYSATFDEFGIFFYGLGIGSHYAFDDNLFVHGKFDVSVFHSDMERVFWNNKVINEPHVIGISADVDVGYRYSIDDSFYVVPFMGIGVDSYKLDTVDKRLVPVYGGVNVGYAFSALGLRYEYDVGIKAGTDEALKLTGRAGFWSDYDAVGGDINVSVLRMFDMTSYQISVGGRLWF